MSILTYYEDFLMTELLLPSFLLSAFQNLISHWQTKPLSVISNILARPHKNGCFSTMQYMVVVLQKSEPQD